MARITPSALDAARLAMARVGTFTASYLRNERFTGGTTDSKLAVRTGRLRASVRPDNIKVEPDSVEAGVSFGTIYARVHVGPRGQVTTIRPKRAKMLAIPLAAAMTAAGVSKGTPRRGPWGETFIRALKNPGGKGQAIIFGKQEITKGPRAGKLRAKIVPLFILMRSVEIKARIHPEEILDYMEPRMRKELLSQGIKVV